MISKTIVLAFFAAATLSAFGSSANPSTSCENIRDRDARYYCKAVTHKDAIYCESIKDHDLRYMCKAFVR